MGNFEALGQQSFMVRGFSFARAKGCMYTICSMCATVTIAFQISMLLSPFKSSKFLCVKEIICRRDVRDSEERL